MSLNFIGFASFFVITPCRGHGNSCYLGAYHDIYLFATGGAELYGGGTFKEIFSVSVVRGLVARFLGGNVSWYIAKTQMQTPRAFKQYLGLPLMEVNSTISFYFDA